MKRMGAKINSGFTIVELLIVIVVIAILAAISIVAFTGVQQRARDAERKQDIAAAQKALQLYFVDHAAYPKQGGVAPDSMQSFDFINGGVIQLTSAQATAPGRPDTIRVSGADTENTRAFSEGHYGPTASTTGMYGYRATRANGAGSCWQTTAVCSGYELWYRLETPDSEGKTVMQVVGGDSTCSTDSRVSCTRVD